MSLKQGITGCVGSNSNILHYLNKLSVILTCAAISADEGDAAATFDGAASGGASGAPSGAPSGDSGDIFDDDDGGGDGGQHDTEMPQSPHYHGAEDTVAGEQLLLLLCVCFVSLRCIVRCALHVLRCLQ